MTETRDTKEDDFSDQLPSIHSTPTTFPVQGPIWLYSTPAVPKTIEMLTKLIGSLYE